MKKCNFIDCLKKEEEKNKVVSFILLGSFHLGAPSDSQKKKSPPSGCLLEPKKGANTSILQVYQIEAHYFFFQLKFYPKAGEKFGS